MMCYGEYSGIAMDGRWMDDMRFYVLFNSISVISGLWKVDNERLMQWNSVYG